MLSIPSEEKSLLLPAARGGRCWYGTVFDDPFILREQPISSKFAIGKAKYWGGTGNQDKAIQNLNDTEVGIWGLKWQSQGQTSETIKC